jgi:nicotinate-nucleotide adenylyltransferase
MKQAKNAGSMGILGGTFDPIHHGHLRIALELYQNFAWQEIRLIPCQKPVLQKTAYASTEQRLQMLQLAIAHQPGLLIDQRELKRPTPSYMVETLSALRAEFPRKSLCLVLGYDVLLGLTEWYRWQELLTYAHLVIIPRLSYQVPATGIMAEFIQQHRVSDAALLQEQPAGLIFFAEVTPLAISATAIRRQIAQGLSPRYLLPDAVLAYIQQENLYQL